MRSIEKMCFVAIGFGISLIGCGPGPVLATKGGKTIQGSVQLSYQPPMVPIKISYKLPEGEFEISAGTSIATPIGVFEAEVVATVAEENRQKGCWTVVLVVGSKRRLYRLDSGLTPSTVYLPNDRNGKGSFSLDPGSQIVNISIPDPSQRSIASYENEIRSLEKQNRELSDEIASFERRGEFELPALDLEDSEPPSPDEFDEQVPDDECPDDEYKPEFEEVEKEIIIVDSIIKA